MTTTTPNAVYTMFSGDAFVGVDFPESPLVVHLVACSNENHSNDDDASDDTGTSSVGTLRSSSSVYSSVMASPSPSPSHEVWVLLKD
jgi:hypothetical protein